jgi:hypothetical protein
MQDLLLTVRTNKRGLTFVWTIQLHREGPRLGSGIFVSSSMSPKRRDPEEGYYEDIAASLSLQGFGIYPTILRLMRQLLGPLRSDKALTSGARKAWQRAGGEFNDQRGYLQRNPYRRNSDRDLRDLERAAASGDLQAAHRLEIERFRIGTSRKNIDADILTRRIHQWCGISQEIETFLTTHGPPGETGTTYDESDDWESFSIDNRHRNRWMNSIIEALASEPVNAELLREVYDEIDSYDDYIREHLHVTYEQLGALVEGLTLSEIWENSGLGLHSHLKTLVKCYDTDRSPLAEPSYRKTTWHDVDRGDYAEMDKSADIVVELNHPNKGYFGKLDRRGPLFMIVIAPKTKIEVMLSLAGTWQWAPKGEIGSEENNLSIYRGTWREHIFEVRELSTNQWHAEVDDQGNDYDAPGFLTEHGEIGENWEDAARLLGEWVDRWITTNQPWLKCDICNTVKIHDDDACRLCNNASERMIIEDQLINSGYRPLHMCYLCLYHSDGTHQVCSSCATVCSSCNGVVCPNASASCKECQIPLCDDFECAPRCVSCDSNLCTDHRIDGKYGSTCKECFAKED